jgi:hypothetical protein
MPHSGEEKKTVCTPQEFFDMVANAKGHRSRIWECIADTLYLEDHPANIEYAGHRWALEPPVHRNLAMIKDAILKVVRDDDICMAPPDELNLTKSEQPTLDDHDSIKSKNVMSSDDASPDADAPPSPHPMMLLASDADSPISEAVAQDDSRADATTSAHPMVLLASDADSPYSEAVAQDSRADATTSAHPMMLLASHDADTEPIVREVADEAIMCTPLNPAFPHPVARYVSKPGVNMA